MMMLRLFLRWVWNSGYRFGLHRRREVGRKSQKSSCSSLLIHNAKILMIFFPSRISEIIHLALTFIHEKEERDILQCHFSTSFSPRVRWIRNTNILKKTEISWEVPTLFYILYTSVYGLVANLCFDVQEIFKL